VSQTFAPANILVNFWKSVLQAGLGFSGESTVKRQLCLLRGGGCQVGGRAGHLTD
jgi:hypothetical protein